MRARLAAEAESKLQRHYQDAEQQLKLEFGHAQESLLLKEMSVQQKDSDQADFIARVYEEARAELSNEQLRLRASYDEAIQAETLRLREAAQRRAVLEAQAMEQERERVAAEARKSHEIPASPTGR